MMVLVTPKEKGIANAWAWKRGRDPPNGNWRVGGLGVRRPEAGGLGGPEVGGGGSGGSGAWWVGDLGGLALLQGRPLCGAPQAASFRQRPVIYGSRVN